jgi:hypothetical protein
MNVLIALLTLGLVQAEGRASENDKESAMSTPTLSARTYVWHREMDAGSHEHAVVVREGHRLRIEGRILAVDAGAPTEVHYALQTDAEGISQSLQLRQADAEGERRLSLWHDGQGNWWRDGEPALELEGCTDIDLGLSPSTNALPLARLRRAHTREAEIRAAWVRFPGLRVEPAVQAYRQLDDIHWQYLNVASGFSAELELDDWSLPRHYAGIWRLIGRHERPVELVGQGFADALVAAGPHASLGQASDDLAWLVGGWQAEVRDFDADGGTRTGVGEWWFAWVLEGRAMQDVWISPPRTARGGTSQGTTAAIGASSNRYGTTLRTFEHARGRWRIRWTNPVSGAENQLEGRRKNDRIVLLGEIDGVLHRWQFIDIRDDSFTWQGYQLQADGEHWALTAQFDLRRIR